MEAWARYKVHSGVTVETPRKLMFPICPSAQRQICLSADTGVMDAFLKGQNSDPGLAERQCKEWQCPHGLFICPGKC